MASRPASGWIENRDPYLRRLDGLLYGENPREGLVRGTTFIHPDLRFQVRFPDGWAINNGKKEVLVKAPGDDQTVMLLQLVEKPVGSSIEAVATQAMRDDGFDLLRGDQTTVNGLPAFVGTYEATVEDVGIVRMQAAHVVLDRQVYMIGGLTLRSQYSARRQLFADTIESFAPLGREEAARIRPSRLTFATVREGDTWRGIAQRTGGLIKPRSLAILNGLGPESRRPRGGASRWSWRASRRPW